MEKLFYNGTILTMEDDLYVQAVLVTDQVIRKIGDFETLRLAAPSAKLIDLKHKTMLPAFIDAHGHFSSYANAQLQVPLEESADFSEIEERITQFIKFNDIPPGEWVVAKGYDHNMLAEKGHPSIEILDHILPDHPLVLQHQSGHCGVFNSKALKALDITLDTQAPYGGVIGRENGKLTGYMEEEAYIQYIQSVPTSSFKELLGAYRKVQENYFSYGITTVQEGMMVTQMVPLYQALLSSGLLTVDVVGYPAMDAMNAVTEAFPDSWKQYDHHFKIGGYKIFLDGSPQVKTAWMKSAYRNEVDYCGYGTMDDAAVLLAVEKAASQNIQILAHCNGDRAIAQYLDAIEKAASAQPAVLAIRPVIIHAQLMTEEQLRQGAKLHVIPSFFLAHVLHWGDIHIQNFGFDRARTISPANTARNCGVAFTFHQDAPVIEPNMLETIQCAVTRETKEGLILGADECISVMDALKAVTINAAYQYFEEDRKGSIKEGKQADLVILDKNPLDVPQNEIRDIAILETIKAGETVFRQLQRNRVIWYDV